MEDQGGPQIVDKKIVVSSSEQTNDEINDPTVDDRSAANFERPGIKFQGIRTCASASEGIMRGMS